MTAFWSTFVAAAVGACATVTATVLAGRRGKALGAAQVQQARSEARLDDVNATKSLAETVNELSDIVAKQQAQILAINNDRAAQAATIAQLRHENEMLSANIRATESRSSAAEARASAAEARASAAEAEATRLRLEVANVSMRIKQLE